MPNSQENPAGETDDQVDRSAFDAPVHCGGVGGGGTVSVSVSITTIDVPVAELRDLRRLSLRHPVSCCLFFPLFRHSMEFVASSSSSFTSSCCHGYADSSDVLQPWFIAPVMTELLA
jgi:hypothetical protein